MKQTFLLLLFTISLRLHSQSSLHGKITDSTGAAVPYIAVALVQASDSSLYKGSVTDDNGVFVFDGLKKSLYLIKINAIGYKDYYSKVITQDSLSQTELPTITLRASGNNLDEVTISAIKRPVEFKNGNIIVNVEGTALAIGNSVYDLLSRMPGVTVDNENISIQGRQGVVIYIDGRPQPLSGAQLINLLKSMNASSVEKVEIIKNPSSKYDAAGSAGIIDIKTKKLKITGFSGGLGYTFSKGYAVTNNANLSLNYKGKKISFFSSINLYEGTIMARNDLLKTVEYNGETTVLNSKSKQVDVGKNGSCNLGLDWYIDKKNTIGFRYQYIPGYAKRTRVGNNAVTGSDLGYDNLLYKRTVPNTWHYSNYNLNAEHLFDTSGTKLKFSTDLYGPYDDVYSSVYQYNFTDNGLNEIQPPRFAHSENYVNLNIISSRLDFEKKLSKTLNFETGVKGSYQDIISNYDFKNLDLQTGNYITDTLFTNKFIYHEEISAAYVNFQKEIKKVSLQIGLRAENTVVKSKSELKAFAYGRQYFKLFPSFNSSYNPSDKHSFSLSYNRRISRPDYNSFNPYYTFNDLFSINKGNPYLLPEIFHHVELSHTFRSRFSNSFSYMRSQNPIRPQGQLDDSTKISYFQVGNLKSSNEMNYFISYNGDLKKWYNLTLNVGAFYYDFKGNVSGQNLNTSAFSYYGYMNSVFLLPKSFKVEISGFLVGPWLWGGYYKIKPRGALNFAVKKTLLKDKLNLVIAVYDIFYTSISRNSVNFGNQNYSILETYDSRRLNVGVSYNFGNIKARQRQINTNDEEKGRIGR